MDESALFQYVSSSVQNRDTFRQWEEEWLLSQKTDANVEKKWERLQRKIQTREAIAPLIKFPAAWSFLRKIAAVAAIVIVTTGSVIGIAEIAKLQRKPDVFVFETPRGEKSKIILSDGSTVHLNSGSKLTYSDGFNKSNRNVELDGEAYFEVTEQGRKNFTVKTPKYSIVVKGTKFNVTSYQEDNHATTTLMEGRVELLYRNETVQMKPGESVQLDVRSNKLVRTEVQSVQYKSWVEGNIKYDAITLEELLNRLSRQYDVTIHYEAVKNKNRTLSVSLKNRETIQDVLRGISMAVPIQIRYHESDIYISD
jgi:ferric-dicitrate binding protein FerR (iron transport regulator)